MGTRGNAPSGLGSSFTLVYDPYQLGYARLVSAGSGAGLGAGNGKIDTTIHNNLDAGDRGDDRVLYLKIPDPDTNQSCDD